MSWKIPTTCRQESIFLLRQVLRRGAMSQLRRGGNAVGRAYASQNPCLVARIEELKCGLISESSGQPAARNVYRSGLVVVV